MKLLKIYLFKVNEKVVLILVYIVVSIVNLDKHLPVQ